MAKILVPLILALICSGCSSMSAAGRQCEKWRSSGEVYARLETCIKCVENIGGSNPQVIQGCAFGIEAGNLLDIAS